MLDHEIYDIVLSRIKTIVEESVIGEVFAYKDFCNYHIWIHHPKMGDFHYKIQTVYELDCNKDLCGDRLANMVLRWHKKCVLNNAFKARNDP